MSPRLVIDRIADTEGSAVILTVRGDLDYRGAITLRSALAAIDADEVTVRLDDLNFLDSSGLAALIDAKGGSSGRVVHFEGANGDVRSLLVRTGTLEFIEG